MSTAARSMPNSSSRGRSGRQAANSQDRTGSVAAVEEIDRILDEIDAVLEGQAVLAGFRQRPGQ